VPTCSTRVRSARRDRPASKQRHAQQVRGTVWGARGPCLWLFIASIGRGRAPAMSRTARLRGESGEQHGEGVS